MRLTTTQMTMNHRQPRPSQAVGRAASRGMRRSRLLSRLQYATWIWSSTSATPGAGQAASTASSCSADELDVPVSVTRP
jgi:hypothetical protein